VLFDYLLLQIRDTCGKPESLVRPYMDVGPGVNGFGKPAFEVEAGGGLDFYLGGGGSVGFNAQYKEVIGSDDVDRGVAVLLTLGYHAF
jgi:hypothetical protein